MRVAYWDVETSDLLGDKGRILCASVLDATTGEMRSFRNDVIAKRHRKPLSDDSEIARQLRDHLETFNLTVGWFTKGFDISFLNTRLVKAGLRPLASHLHLDPIWYCKGWRGLKARSASMKVMAEFFGVDRKLDVDIDVWIDAALGGDSAAMDILVERCEADVRTTQQITQKILDAGLVKNISKYP